MSVPLTDLHVKYVVDFTIRTVLKNPDKYLPEIFGDAKIDPHAALLGDRYIQSIKNWLTTVNIPVVLGFELDPAQIPGVTIHLQSNTPVQPFIGDTGFVSLQPIQKYERMVAVPTFSPKDIVPSADGTYIAFTPPDNLDPTLSQLIIPNFHIFDKNQREYGIGILNANPIAVQSGNDKLSDADLSQITVVSPYPDVQIRGGAMYYDNTVTVACHGHADRNEGLWLWAIVQWGLLKYRPLLTATFGLDLALPTASDFSKDDSFLGENVWTRYVNLTTKSVWSWSGAQSTDLVAFLTTILEQSESGEGPANPLADTLFVSAPIPAPPPPPPTTYIPPIISDLVVRLCADGISQTTGTALSHWVDASPAANDVFQASAPNKPIFNTGVINGKAAVQFSGAQFLSATTQVFDPTQPYTLYFVIRQSGTSHQDAGIVGDYAGGGGDGDQIRFLNAGSPQIRVVDYVDVSTGVPVDNFGYYTITQSGTTSFSGSANVRANGAGVGGNGGPRPSSGTMNFTIGGMTSSGFYLTGDVALVLLYQGVVHSAPQIATMEASIASYYGL